MRFSHSLKLNHIFRRLYRSGKNAANRYLVLYCRGNGSKGNRVRRQLREIYRLHEQEFKPGHDLVVVVRSRAIGASYGKLEEAYLALAAQLGLLREDV